jgi:gliding motility-associated-like protein
LDNVDVTGKIKDLCITGVHSLRGETPSTDPLKGETVQWTTVTGTSVTGVNKSTASHGVLTLASEGTTKVSYTITSTVPGCSPETRELTLKVHALPVATVTVDILDTCKNIDKINVTTGALGTTDVGTWTSTLKPTAGTPATAWSFSGADLQVGNNTIVWSVVNPGCAPKAVPAVIKIDAMTTPIVNLNPLGTKCYGDKATYNAIASGGGVGASYLWDFDGDAIPAAIGTTQFTVDNVQSNGVVKVVYTSTERCKTKPSAEASVNLNAVPGPEPRIINGPDSTICVTNPIVIEAYDDAGTKPDIVYTWYRKVGLIDVSIGAATAVNDTFKLPNVNVSGIYTLRANNKVCDEVPSDTLNLTVFQVPYVDANLGNRTIGGLEGDFMYLSGFHTGQSAIWSSSSTTTLIENVNDLNSRLITDVGGLYSITLTSTNGPCTAKDSFPIQIRKRLLVPNVFTVNGDGYNETLLIYGIETYPEASVSIFNRWGGIVYQVDNNYMSRPWDGGQSPEGVYYFVIDKNTGEEKGTGHTGVVHLIRK